MKIENEIRKIDAEAVQNDPSLLEMSDEEIVAIYKDILYKYETHLEKREVKIGRKHRLVDENNVELSVSEIKKKLTEKDLQLIFMAKYINCFVHKDTVSDFVQKHIPTANKDQQVRHWGTQMGWFILKAVYDHRCATCGIKEGQADSRNNDAAVVLQQGHMDPNKELTIDNSIPQCPYCNQTYQDRFVFNENGRIAKINKPEVVLDSSPEVQLRMLELLLKKHGLPESYKKTALPMIEISSLIPA